MRVIVTGSRDWSDRGAVWSALAEAVAAVPVDREVVIAHGACPTGADEIAHQWAVRYGATVERYVADWRRGPRAGPERNRRMVADGADLVLAFQRNASRGTQNTIDLARQAGIEVRVWSCNE